MKIVFEKIKDAANFFSFMLLSSPSAEKDKRVKVHVSRPSLPASSYPS
jgi:hypothetical protein